jgi:hypothetical protein
MWYFVVEGSVNRKKSNDGMAHKKAWLCIKA